MAMRGQPRPAIGVVLLAGQIVSIKADEWWPGIHNSRREGLFDQSNPSEQSALSDRFVP
jgi:hypothetical protein